jgi:alkanesulfonate monooxygenase SsuD/methylene tetrahydromethanopterin reductase-like flavin-dependent oxidoreductase (luciferase family)
MDHLAPPMAEDQPMHEAMITAAWLAAHTDRLAVGHLVLCDSLRHPAVLAKQAVTIDHASRGRFELGIGWGSVPDELDAYGVGDTAPSARVRRLAESLEVMTALWSGETVDFEGEFHRVKGARQLPAPLARIPLLIGGAGRKTLALVARYADWWNLPIYALERLEELRPAAGGARVSIQQLVALVPNEAERDRVTELARRRFGIYGDGLVIGDAAQLVDHFTALHDRGVERFYTWFSDFADPETLAAFGADVIETVAPRGGARPWT